MTTNHPSNDAFDRAMRAQYASALDHLSPPVRRRLREGRLAASTARAPAPRAGWLLGGGMATAAVAAIAVAVALQSSPPAQTPAAVAATTTATTDPLEGAVRRVQVDSEVDEMLAALEEDPGLYLWLAATDDTLPPPAELRP
jgi:hypothetical protein